MFAPTTPGIPPARAVTVTAGWRVPRRPPRMVVAAAALFLCTIPAPAHEAIQKQIDELDRLIAAEPGDANLFLRRGELHRIHQDWDAARADYRRARRLDPDLAAVDLCLGRLHLEQERPKKTLSPIDRYIARRPADPEGYLVRARARAALQRREEAVADYRRALSLPSTRPPAPDTWIDLAQLLAAGGETGKVEALRALDEGIAALGPIVSLTIPAIDLEVELGRHDEALRRVDAIAAQAGRRERWVLRRAAILHKAGRHDAAAEAYEETLRLIADLPEDRRAARATQDTLSEACAGLATIADAQRLRAAGCR